MQPFSEPRNPGSPPQRVILLIVSSLQDASLMMGASSLPENVKLLTLARHSERDGVVLRLEHFFERNEDPELSLPASVSLKHIMQSLQLTRVEELLLAANVPRTHVQRLKWTAEERKSSRRKRELVQRFEKPQKKHGHQDRQDDLDEFTVVLEPMQIRTFLLT